MQCTNIVRRPCFTDFGYKNKNHLIHPKSVKYGRRTPKRIFSDNSILCYMGRFVKAVFYFLSHKKTVVAGQQSMKVKCEKLFFVLRQYEPKANTIDYSFIPFPYSKNLSKFRIKIIKIIRRKAAIHFFG